MEEEPNNSIAAADLYPPDGPAMGGAMVGHYNFWRVIHPGGTLRVETTTIDCFDNNRSDTLVRAYNSSGVLVWDNDDIGGSPKNYCSAFGLIGAATGDYFLEVYALSDVPWYALMVRANDQPLGADPQAPVPDLPVKHASR